METLISVAHAGKDRYLKYYCTECHEELTFRHGMEKRKHFAHRPQTNCQVSKKGNGESIVHRYWKQYFAGLNEIWIPRNLIYERVPNWINNYDFTRDGILKSKIRYGDTIEIIPQYCEKVTIAQSVMEKEFALYNGKKIRPDILYTLENGEQIALEIWFTNKKTKEYEFAYAELGIEAYEVQVSNKGHHEITYLYSKGKQKLIEETWDKKVKEDFLQASPFLKSVYEVAAKWDARNWAKPATTPRYNFYLADKSKAYLFRTTYRTFKQVRKSYGHIFGITTSSALERRLIKEGLFKA